MTVFLDVGTHEGQTLEEVTKPAYDFTRIIGFEPMPEQYRVVAERFGDLRNVTLHDYGLSNATGTVNVYGTNANLGASIYARKRDVDADTVTKCRMMRASSWIGVQEGPFVVKLNCEGAEVPILDDLIDSGQIEKVTNVLIDFDCRKVPGLEHEDTRILDRLKAIRFDRYSLAEDVMVGPTHQERIANWLATV